MVREALDSPVHTGRLRYDILNVRPIRLADLPHFDAPKRNADRTKDGGRSRSYRDGAIDRAHQGTRGSRIGDLNGKSENARHGRDARYNARCSIQRKPGW